MAKKKKKNILEQLFGAAMNKSNKSGSNSAIDKVVDAIYTLGTGGRELAKSGNKGTSGSNYTYNKIGGKRGYQATSNNKDFKDRYTYQNHLNRLSHDIFGDQGKKKTEAKKYDTRNSRKTRGGSNNGIDMTSKYKTDKNGLLDVAGKKYGLQETKGYKKYKDENRPRWERAFTGAAKQFFAQEGESIGRIADAADEDVNMSRQQVAAYNAELAKNKKKYGLSDKEAKKRLETSKYFKDVLDRNEKARKQRQQVMEKLNASGTKDIEKAKEGLGGVGQFFVDALAAGVQFGGDTLVSGGAGAMRMITMGARSYAGGVMQAKQEGADENKAELYGLLSAAREVGTEKIFNVGYMNKLMGNSFAGGKASAALEKIASNASNKFAKTKAGKTLLYNGILSSQMMMTEGAEEFIADVIDVPMIRATYNSNEQFDWGEAIKDFAIGGMLGGIGVGGQITQARSDSKVLRTEQENKKDRRAVKRAENASPQSSRANPSGKSPVRQMIDAGLAQSEKSASYQMARQIQDQIDAGQDIIPGQLSAMQNHLAVSQHETQDKMNAARKRALKTYQEDVDAGRIQNTFRDRMATSEATVEEYNQTRQRRGEKVKPSEEAQKKYSFTPELLAANTEAGHYVMAKDRVSSVMDDVGLRDDDAKNVVTNVVTGYTTDARDLDRFSPNGGTEAQAMRTAFTEMTGKELPDTVEGTQEVIMDHMAEQAYINGENEQALSKMHDAFVAVQGIASDLGDEAGHIFEEQLINDNVPIDEIEQYTDAFRSYYTGGGLGLSFEQQNDAGAHYAQQLEGSSMPQVAYEAGLAKHTNEETERAVMEKARKKSETKKKTTKKKAKKKGTFTDNTTDDTISKKDKNILKALAEKIGVDIVLEDTIENGKVNGFLKNGVIHIAADAENPIITVFKHELTHFLQKTAPEEYKALRDFVRDKWYQGSEQALKNSITAKLKRYGGTLTSPDEALDEIIADAAEAFFRDESTINEVIQANRSLGEKILEWIRNLIADIKAMMAEMAKGDSEFKAYTTQELAELGILEEAEKLWAKALAASVQNGETVEGGESRYSFVGYSEDGRGIYVSNYKKGTPKSKKDADILELIQNVWSKNPITLTVVEDGKKKEIHAAYDPYFDENEDTDAGKIAGGNINGSSTERRVNLNLGKDYYQILSEAEYVASVTEDGEHSASSVHRDNQTWHYFINRILYMETEDGEKEPYSVFVNVRENSDGSFVYSYETYKDENVAAALKRKRITMNSVSAEWDESPNMDNSSKGNIPQPSEEVKTRKSIKISTQQDADYMKAIKAGDMETAQKMVDEAAKAAGYTTVAYHGTDAETIKEFTGNPDVTETNGPSRIKGYFSDSEEYSETYGENVNRYYLNTEKFLGIDGVFTVDEMRKDLEKNGVTGVEFNDEMTDEALEEWFDSWGGELGEDVIDPWLFFNSSGGNLTERIQAAGYNGVEWTEGGMEGEAAYMPFDSQLIKSADPVTYDDNGNVIPLSERFNDESSDVRFSKKQNDFIPMVTLSDQRIDNLIDEYAMPGNTTSDYSQAWITSINPRDFLKLTLSDDTLEKWYRPEAANYDQPVRELNAEELKADGKYSPLMPFLRIYSDHSNSVVSHEGRHRMKALMDAGYNDVPVVIVDIDTKQNKQPVDMMDLWSQDFGSGPVNSDNDIGYEVDVYDLIPINEKHRAEIEHVYGGAAKVQFSMKEPVEETHDLIAIHNLSEDELLKSIELGGVVMPSIAIRRDAEHTSYGSVSLLFNKDTIDPQKNAANKVYGGDAWTPTFPRVEYPVDMHKLHALDDRMYELSKSIAGGEFASSMSLIEGIVGDTTTDTEREIAGKLMQHDEILAAYLADQGVEIEPEMREKSYDQTGNQLLADLINAFGGKKRIDDIKAKLDQGEKLSDEDKKTIRNAYAKNRTKDIFWKQGPNAELTEDYKDKVRKLSEEMASRLSDIRMEDMVFHAWEYMTDGYGTKMVVDRLATREKLYDALPEKYNEVIVSWIQRQLAGMLGEPGIYNGRDPYTDTGRRTFKQLHYEYTLDNIIRAMKNTQAERGEGVFGTSPTALQSLVVPKYKSIDDIRQDKGRLGRVGNDEYKEIHDRMEQDIYDLKQDLLKSNGYEANSYGAEYTLDDVIVEAAKKGATTAGPIRAFFKNNSEFEISKDLAGKLEDIFADAALLPTEYFEAKPRRAVDLEEIKEAIIPDSASEELKTALDENGIPYREYELHNNADRISKVNQAADQQKVKFSRKDSDGNNLSEGQRDYFRDSQARDENGNLLVLYHGTPKKGFTVFKDWQYFTANKGYATNYADQDEDNLYKVYANVKKPFDTRIPECREIFENEYLGNYSNTPLQESGLPDWTDGYDLTEFLEENGYDYDAVLLDEGGVPDDNGEVQRRGISYAVRNSNQIKNTDNKTPTENPDIRYSKKSKADQKKYPPVNTYEEAQKLYEGRDFVTDDEMYSYDFLTSLPPMPVTILPVVEENEKKEGKIVTKKIKQNGFEEAKSVGETTEDGIIIANNYTGRSIKVTHSTIGHGLAGNYKRVLTNARAGKVVGLLVKNAVPLNSLLNEAISDDVSGTYAMAAYSQIKRDNDDSYECIVIVTVEEITDEAVDIRLYDVAHSLNGRIKRSETLDIKSPGLILNASTSVISISDLLSVVNETHRSLLSDDVLEHYEEERPIDGYYSSRVRHSRKGIQEEERAIRRALEGQEKTIDLLREKVADLRSEFRRTRVATIDDKVMTKDLKAYLKDWGSEADVEEILKSVRIIHKDLLDRDAADWEHAYAEAEDAAKYIINNVQMLYDDSYNHYADLRKYLREARLELTPSERSDIPDYEAFRKANFGKINLVNNGRPVDVVYAELADMYPEFFNEDSVNTPGDMVMQMVDVLDSLQPHYETMDADREKDAVAEVAMNLMEFAYDPKLRKTWADRAAERQAAAVAKEKEKGKQRRQSDKERYREMIAKIKEERKQAIADLKLTEKQRREKMLRKQREKITQIKKTYKEKATRKQNMDSIKRNAEYLSQALLKPTEAKHIPQAYRAAVAKLLGSLDFESVRTDAWIKKYGQPSARVQGLREMSAAYREIQRSGEFEHLEDPYFEMLLDSLAEHAQGMRLSDMDNAQLADMATIVKALRHNISRINRAFNENIRETIAELGDRSIEELEKQKRKGNYGGAAGLINKWLNESNVNPTDFFETLGSDTLNSIYQEIRKGFDQHVLNMDEAKDRLQSIVNKKQAAAWSEKSKTEKFDLSNGQTVEITPAQKMTLWCLMQRDQAKQHILGQGIVLDSVLHKERNIIKRAFFGNKTRQQDGTLISFQDVYQIISTLTDEQKAVCQGVMGIMNDMCKNWGNEASMKLYGYEKFAEDNYFPIQSAKEWLDTNSQQENVIPKIKNQGMTKATNDNANNPIVVGDIFNIVTKHVNDMSMYNTLAVPLTDFERVYNYKQRNDAGGLTGKTTKSVLTNYSGDRSLRYINQWLKDVNNYRENDTEVVSKISNKLLANYKKATIGFNLRVLIQQPTALVRSMILLNPRDVAKVLVQKPAIATIKEMQEHSPLARWKANGHFETDISRSLRDDLMGKRYLLDRVTMDPYGFADNLAWASMWKAVKNEINRTRPELTQGSDEYWQAVNERFEYVMDRTQVIDSVFHRSQVMRNQNIAVKMLSSFMAEPTKTFNMLRTECIRAAREWQAGNKQEAAGIFSRVGSVFLINAAAVSAAAAVIDLIRDAWDGDDDDDDKEQSKWDKYFKYLKNNFAGNANPLAQIVGGNTIFNALDGFDTENLSTKAIGDMIDMIDKWKKYAEGDSKFSLMGMLKQTIAPLGQLIGVPLKNGEREFETVYRSIIGATAGWNVADYMRAKNFQFDKKNDKAASEFMKIWQKAMTNNDEKGAQIIKEDMIKEGIATEDDFAKRVWKMFGEGLDKEIQGDEYKDIQKAEEERKNTPDKVAKKEEDHKKKTKLLRNYLQKGDDKIVSRINKLLDAGADEAQVFDKIKGYMYDKLDYDMEQGKVNEVRSGIKNLNTLGVPKDDLKSKVRVTVKAKYVEAFDADDTDKMDELDKLLKVAGEKDLKHYRYSYARARAKMEVYNAGRTGGKAAAYKTAYKWMNKYPGMYGDTRYLMYAIDRSGDSTKANWRAGKPYEYVDFSQWKWPKS